MGSTSELAGLRTSFELRSSLESGQTHPTVRTGRPNRHGTYDYLAPQYVAGLGD